MAVLSGLLAALLASILWWRAEVEAVRSRLRRSQRQERELCATVHALLAAARRASDDVIATLEQAIRRVEPRIDAVLIFVPSDDELRCVHASGDRAGYYSDLRLTRDPGTSLPARAAVTAQVTRSRENDCLVTTDQAAIAVPMIDERGLRAIVYASSSVGLQGSDPLVERFVEYAVAPYAIALEREADRNEATYDALTGLLAPRAFRTRLRDEIARAESGAGPALSLWFLDTDGFKAVNDAFGHAAGDRVLQQMGALLQRHLHADLDVAARNGGDEFCALVRGVPKTRSILRAVALCAEVRDTDFGIGLPLSASIGVASFPSDARVASELLELADGAMYHSKRNGRNRVSFAVGRERFVVAQ